MRHNAYYLVLDGQLQAELKAWHDHAKSVSYDDEQRRPQGTISEKPDAAAVADEAAARERLFARFGKSR